MKPQQHLEVILRAGTTSMRGTPEYPKPGVLCVLERCVLGVNGSTWHGSGQLVWIWAVAVALVTTVPWVST